MPRAEPAATLSRAGSRTGRYAEPRRKLSQPLYCAALRAEPAAMLSRPAIRARCSAEPRDRHSCSLDLPCEYAPLRKGTDPTDRRTPHRCRCEARRAAASRLAVKRKFAQRCPRSRTAFFDDTSDLKRGHIPPNIRLRSEPMDPDNSFGHGLPLTASSRSASGKQRKLVREH